MKTKSRISRNNTIKSPIKQGQTQAHLSHEPFDTRGKVTLGAVRIGEALDLDENQIKALALFAAWQGSSPALFAKLGFIYYMQPVYDQIVAEAGNGDTPQKREIMDKFMLPLNWLGHRLGLRIVQNPPPGMVPETTDAKNEGFYDGVNHLESAMRQSAALNHLILQALDSGDADAYHADNGYLAAGVQSLMRDCKKKLEAARDQIRKDCRP